MWTRIGWSSGDMRNERISDEERGYLSSGNPDQSAHNQPTSRSLTQHKPRKATQLSTDQITNLETDELNEEFLS